MLRAGIFTIVPLFFVSFLNAQTNHGICGNGGGEWDEILTERLLRNKQALDENPLQFRNTVYVPIRFHMVANNSGFGRVTHAQVLDLLCRLNQDFAGMNMQFYIKALSENINNTAIYSTQYTAGTVMNLMRDNAAMNVWIVDVAAGSPPSPNDPPGTTLGYYSPARDWIVIRRDQANSSAVTMAHEVGHFFSLKHTHNGWDSQPYSAATHGTPAPATSPGGVATERQDGSNCNTAGDFICDTPPDYNGLGFNGCDYNIAQDPSGVPINPDEQLFMSYFLSCVRNDYYFSPTQENLMIADYNHSSRNYLRNNAVTPNLTEITQVPTPNFPINNQFTPGFNSVTFNWTAVTGADFYLLEIDVAQSFSSNPIRIVVPNANSHTVTTLEANRTYFWRVRPYNAYRTCAPFSPVAQFRTNSMVVSTNDITDLDSWTIVPNPVALESVFQVSLRANKGFEGIFTLYNPAGQVVRRLGAYRIQGGENTLDFNTAPLQPGLYILALDHEGGREVRRIVVAR